jgi:membrane protein DedA with SNARE-associated domain
MDFLHELGTHIQNFMVDAGYPAIFLLMVLEVVFPPIPSELVLPYAGFLVGQDKMNFVGVWVSSQLGAVAGALLLYYIGQLASDHMIRGFLQKRGRWIGISENDYDRTLRVFQRYGEIIILGGRLIPIIRSLVSIPAGADHMPMRKFLLYTVIGTGIWNFILVFAGMQLGENWGKVEDLVTQYQKAVIVVGSLVIVVFLVWWVRRMMQMWRQPPAESMQPADD